MYYGKMTKELEELYEAYFDMFDDYPDCHEELEYGNLTYKSYVKDIKKALKKGKCLTEVVKFKHIPGVDD